MNLHFLTGGLLNRLYFRSVCCLIQFFSHDSQFFQTELCFRRQISLYAFDFIKCCGSCCPFFVSVTVHSVCLLLPILRGLLLPILRVSYCPSCGVLLPILPGLLLPILRVSYCPSCGVLLPIRPGLLLSILCVSYCPFLLPILRGVTAH